MQSIQPRALSLRALATALVLMVVQFVLPAIGSAQETKADNPKPLQVASSYKLQTGDEIKLSVFQHPEYDATAVVSPDGMLYLSSVPPVKGLGLTLDDLKKSVVTELKKDLKRPEVYLSLTKLGSPLVPKITVVGAVERQGIVPLEDGLRVRKALELAGGTTKNADLARVIITGKDLKRTVLDLRSETNVLDPSVNRVLSDGDSIEVPVQPFLITVVGEVQKPGPVELSDGLRLYKAIELAGGPTTEADLAKVVLTRSDLNRTTFNLTGGGSAVDPTTNPLLKDGDSIQVPAKFLPGVVGISGAVLNPGTYPLKTGLTLNDVIIASGKMSLLADVEHVQIRHLDKTVETVNLLNNGGTTQLKAGDEVTIPEFKDTVFLLAPTEKPGPRPLKPGQTIHQFMLNPDVFSVLDPSKVDLGKVQIWRGNTAPTTINVKKLMAQPSRKDNVALMAGDIVYVPPRGQKGKLGLMDAVRNIPYLAPLFGFF